MYRESARVRNVAGAVGPRLMSSRPQVEVVFDLTRLPFELRVKVAIAAALQRSTSRARRLSRVCREFRQAIAPLQWSILNLDGCIRAPHRLVYLFTDILPRYASLVRTLSLCDVSYLQIQPKDQVEFDRVVQMVPNISCVKTCEGLATFVSSCVHLPALTRLYFNFSRTTDTFNAAALVSSCPNLIELRLELCDSSDSTGREVLLVAIGSRRSLTTLDFVSRGYLSLVDELARVDWQCPLTRLSIDTSEGLNAISLDTVLSHFSNSLRDLTVILRCHPDEQDNTSAPFTLSLPHLSILHLAPEHQTRHILAMVKNSPLWMVTLSRQYGINTTSRMYSSLSRLVRVHKTIKHVRIESNEGNYMCRPDVQPLVPWAERLGIELVDRWRPGVIYFQVEDYSEDYSDSDVPRIVQDHSDGSDGSEDGEQEDEEEEEDDYFEAERKAPENESDESDNGYAGDEDESNDEEEEGREKRGVNKTTVRRTTARNRVVVQRGSTTTPMIG